MNSMEQRITRAAESILENENLTTDLNDEAAQVVIDWGIHCAREIALRTVECIDDEDAEKVMYRPMRALRRMIRYINKWSANINELDRDSGSSTLGKILDEAQAVYGKNFRPPSEQIIADLLNRQDQLKNRPVAFLAELRSAIENPPQKI